MAGTLNASEIAMFLRWDWQDDELPGLVSSSSLTYQKQFAAGTGQNAADKVFIKKYTIAGAATQTLDLAGVLQDPGKNTLIFTKIRAIFIHHSDEGEASSISFGPGGSNPVTGLFDATNDRLRVNNPGVVAVASATTSGYPVTAGSADTIDIINNDGTEDAIVYVGIVGE